MPATDYRRMAKPPLGLAIPTSIKQRREALGWGLEELAASSGLSPTTIHNLEAEKNGFTDKSLLAIATALGCSPAELLMPLGSPKQSGLITTEPQILATLARIEGLKNVDINLAFGVIKNALDARRAAPAPSASNDQLQPAIPRRG